jgi:hypothetical protein
VVGYPLGTESSFVTILQKELEKKSISVGIYKCAYSNLKKVNEAIKICEETNPDILILQAGNYLFNPILFKAIRKKIKNRSEHQSKGMTEKMPSCIPGIDINSLFAPDKKFLVSQFFKRLIHELIFFKALNRKKCSRYIATYFDAVKSKEIGSVLVLGAFPTQDHVMNKYRQIGNRILYQKCFEYGFKCVDVFDFIKQNFGGRVFTVDFMHLSKEAHLELGRHIANTIFEHYPGRHENKSFASYRVPGLSTEPAQALN